ncbi:hypothetical protein [Nocardioides jiangxiensis]|uniref:PknH-like extracellular domain-containing protein n=1 Tax=Nocardioides jiangxiensis TaxID=3064524 RepID=A0ABT9B478_9ACTN|nr:hypothetical protein [Nocardioides sp. WY-20]MDO7869646.1 hypothetical protein [Nocardioides sp. WY-20]
MSRSTVVAAVALAVLAPLLVSCGADGPDPALVRALEGRGGMRSSSLYLPVVRDEKPDHWRVARDRTVTLYWKRDGTGFDGTATLQETTVGDLCTGRSPQWDQCRRIDADVAVLGFEEQNEVVVRTGGDEIVFGVSLELPDEDYPTAEALRDAQDEIVNAVVMAGRYAEALDETAFVTALPRGKVG